MMTSHTAWTRSSTSRTEITEFAIPRPFDTDVRDATLERTSRSKALNERGREVVDDVLQSRPRPKGPVAPRYVVAFDTRATDTSGIGVLALRWQFLSAHKGSPVIRVPTCALVSSVRAPAETRSRPTGVTLRSVELVRVRATSRLTALLVPTPTLVAGSHEPSLRASSDGLTGWALTGRFSSSLPNEYGLAQSTRRAPSRTTTRVWLGIRRETKRSIPTNGRFP